MQRLSAVLFASVLSSSAIAEPPRGTALLEVNLKTGKTARIDAARGDALDAEMDAVLGRAGAKQQSFTTKDLDLVEQRLLADLKRERPRATPQLLVFVYPGRLSAERLRSLAEVFVDIEILIDPCERSVCREAVGRHIELVGQAVGKPVRQTPRFKLQYKNLVLRTSTQFREAESGEVRVPMDECVAASAKRGNGLAWLDRMSRSVSDYEPLVAKAVARQASRRRVSLASPPRVMRTKDEAEVVLTIRGDRSRLQSQVIDAMVAAAQGLRENPATPPATSIEVHAQIPMRQLETRRFRSLGRPVLSHLDREIDAGTLWSTYVREVTPKRGATNLSFTDEETRGGGGTASGASDGDAVEVLSQQFGALRDCARAEIGRNPRFSGVTLTFRWLPSGKADAVSTKEAASRGGTLERCLATAVARMRFPAFEGSPRAVEFPIRIKKQ
jgi:hypothetical protein